MTVNERGKKHLWLLWAIPPIYVRNLICTFIYLFIDSYRLRGQTSELLANATHYVWICRRKNRMKNEEFIRHVIWTAVNRIHCCGLIWVKVVQQHGFSHTQTPSETIFISMRHINSNYFQGKFFWWFILYAQSNLINIQKKIVYFPILSRWVWRNVPVSNSWLLLYMKLNVNDADLFESI